MSGTIYFLHPDLGIGGAERAIVDAAIALKIKGYKVKLFTNHHNVAHCFEETKGELEVNVVADWFPRHIFGRFMALCAYIRFILLALYVSIWYNKKVDLLFVDQISASLFILRLFNFKVLFYCHFPDQLLTKRNNWLKRAYRAPIDYLEERTTGLATKVLVNSNFTASVFKNTFTSLNHIEPCVLYPVPNIANLFLPTTVLNKLSSVGVTNRRGIIVHSLTGEVFKEDVDFTFVSVNRYERKKNVALAIFAFGHLIKNWNALVTQEPYSLMKNKVRLVIAGGYDARVDENVKYHLELLDLTLALNVSSQVTFIRSCSSETKAHLLAAATAVLYTPDSEHFGIVPVEAMHLRSPVIALASGGPAETIIDGKTGFLLKPPNSAVESSIDQTRLAADMAAKMATLLSNPDLVDKMGNAGYDHVHTNLSFATFQKKLCSIVEAMLRQ